MLHRPVVYTYLAAELSLVDAGYTLMPSWTSLMIVYEAMASSHSYPNDLFLGCQPDIIDSVGLPYCFFASGYTVLGFAYYYKLQFLSISLCV